MTKDFDAIVLGIGSMGAATCYYLAKQGYKVLGLEQFDIPHDQGSHAGQSRIIRKAYFEHPDYVPLLQRAYENWKEIEVQSDAQIYFPTGLLYAGKTNETLVKGVMESAEKYSINVESISQAAARERFPQFQLPKDYEILFEPDAGFVTPERAILCYVEQAIRNGVVIHTKEKTISWKKAGASIIVTTNKATYICDKLVITAGAWAGSMISELASQFKVTRQLIAWMNPKESRPFELGTFPCWMIDDHEQEGMMYGFPVLPVGKFGGPVGLKVAHHFPGKVTDPDAVDRVPSGKEESDLISAFTRFLPEGYQTTHVLKTCLYTNTPDEHFIIDFLPGHDQQVVVAAGFSGHGFKFASVVGEVLADLTTQGKTNLPIGFLSAHRLGY